MPLVPAAGVPESTSVAVSKVTPDGSKPVLAKRGAGYPEDSIVNDPDDPTVKVALLALVMAGGSLTVSVTLCVAPDPTPFEAVMAIE